MEKLKLYHWEFYIDNHDMYVYDTRSGETLGYLPGYTLDDINDICMEAEEDVYQWIDKNIKFI